MAGIYFDYDALETTSLTGFVDMGGSLDVLDLISISVDFHMELTYTNTAGKSSVTGEAQLTVDVKVCSSACRLRSVLSGRRLVATRPPIPVSVGWACAVM